MLDYTTVPAGLKPDGAGVLGPDPVLPRAAVTGHRASVERRAAGVANVAEGQLGPPRAQLLLLAL